MAEQFRLRMNEMDTLLNIRAFIAIAEAGSLSAAARKLNVATSVISKRLGRLEDETKMSLFSRSTRHIALTPAGEDFLPRCRLLVQEMDELVRGAKIGAKDIEGHLRIKSPTTLAVTFFGRFFGDFQAKHPGVAIELTLLDRSINPNEEGFDLALGALPSSYVDITDVPLCIYPRLLCASPEYLARRGTPRHPSDLSHHDCIALQASGTSWSFESAKGDITVAVRSSFMVNESGVLLDAACRGHGVTIVGNYMAHQSLLDGHLVHLLPEYPVHPLWLKAMVPTKKRHNRLIQLLLDELVAFTQPVAPWDRLPSTVQWLPE